MLTEREATQIVDDSIFMAGGDQGPFSGNPTLKEAGLIVAQQRDSFQHRC